MWKPPVASYELSFCCHRIVVVVVVVRCIIFCHFSSFIHVLCVYEWKEDVYPCLIFLIYNQDKMRTCCRLYCMLKICVGRLEESQQVLN